MTTQYWYLKRRIVTTVCFCLFSFGSLLVSLPAKASNSSLIINITLGDCVTWVINDEHGHSATGFNLQPNQMPGSIVGDYITCYDDQDGAFETEATSFAIITPSPDEDYTLTMYTHHARPTAANVRIELNGKIVNKRFTFIGDENGVTLCPFTPDPIDTDGDGVRNKWEAKAVQLDPDCNDLGDLQFPPVNDLPSQILDLPAMGANPSHKDIFVHADWMPGRKPLASAIQIVTQAFMKAPVENSDKINGINLHVDLGSNSVMNPINGEKWGGLSEANQIPFEALTIITDTKATDQVARALSPYRKFYFDSTVRHTIFHYACFCNQFGILDKNNQITPKPSSGIADVLGSNFMITLGTFPTVGGTQFQQAGTFMHELGHNLGLLHGGNTSINGKPNYLSIMNYLFQLNGLFMQNGSRVFDYSHRSLPGLDELSLDESIGINDPDQHLTLWNTYVRPASSNQCLTHPNSYYKRFPYPELDWDCDGTATLGITTSVDINGDGVCVKAGDNRKLDTVPAGDDFAIADVIVDGVNRTCETKAANNTDDKQEHDVNTTEDVHSLTGYNDWANIQLSGNGGIGQLGASVPISVALIDEPSFEDIRRIVPDDIFNAEATYPTGEFTASPLVGASPLTVNFDGSTAIDPDGSVVSWVWDFGDGTTGTGKTTSHVYNTSGTYIATLHVTDNMGNANLFVFEARLIVTSGTIPTSTSTPTATATSIPTNTPVPPTATFTPTNTPPAPPTVTFTPTPIRTPVKVNSQLEQKSFKTTSSTKAPDATYHDQSPKGVVVMTLKLENDGKALRNVSFRVTKLTHNNYLLNADGGPGQVGSKLSVPNSALPSGNQLWDKNEHLTQAFRIGLLSRSSFTIRVDVYAIKVKVAAAEAGTVDAPETEELVDSFFVDADPETLITSDYMIYLPVVSK